MCVSEANSSIWRLLVELNELSRLINAVRCCCTHIHTHIHIDTVSGKSHELYTTHIYTYINIHAYTHTHNWLFGSWILQRTHEGDTNYYLYIHLENIFVCFALHHKLNSVYIYIHLVTAFKYKLHQHKYFTTNRPNYILNDEYIHI